MKHISTRILPHLRGVHKDNESFRYLLTIIAISSGKQVNPLKRKQLKHVKKKPYSEYAFPPGVPMLLSIN